MNSFERIMATVSGSDADYQPFTLLLSLYGASMIETDTLDYYNDPGLWFEGQKAVIETFDPDIVITPFSLPKEAEAFGCELVFINKYVPNIKKPIITDLSQIADMQLPDLNHSNTLSYFQQGVSFLAEKYLNKKAIAAAISSPCDTPALLMGVEMWIDTLLFHPDSVDLMIKKATEHFIRFGNDLLNRGATFLVVPVNFTNPLIITQNIFLKLLPYLEDAFKQIKGPIVIHNAGCILKPFLSFFAKLPNVIGFVIDPRESFEESRQLVGNDLVLMGNFDGPNMVNMTIEKAKELSLKILNDRKEDKHFIFATSNADIPYQTSVETIKTIVDTIRNFKKY